MEIIKTSILTILILLGQVIFPQSATADGAHPDIAVTPTSINFGTIPVGTYSPPETITVTNNGNADLIINNIDFSGTDASQFLIFSIDTTSQIIPPGESASGTVVFGPTSAGDKSARLRIHSNDPCDPWAYVNLSGTGVYDPSYQPDINVVPEAINFGLVQTWTQSPPRTVTVTNNGNANLVIYSANIAGTDALQFFIGSAPGTSGVLTPGESANGTIVFRPTSTGDKSAYLRIYSNDPNKTWVYVDLRGKGVIEPVVPDIAVAPMSIDFGTVQAGSTSAAANVTVTNEGIGELNIGTLSINNSQFDILSGISGPLAPDTSANITLVFSPTTIGDKSGTLTIPSNDTDENPVLVELKGLGTPQSLPDIDVTPMSLDFGSTIRVGQTGSQRLVTIKNTGNADLEIGTLTKAGANPGDFIIFSDNASGKTLPPGSSALVYLRFRPTAVGLRTGSLQIPSNDPDESTVAVALTGTALGTPDISVDPLDIDFGSVQVGQSSPSRTVTITNTGSISLSIDVVAKQGPGSNHFVITDNNASGRTLAPGESATVTLAFRPTTTGNLGAILNIASYTPPTYPYEYVSLHGRATAAPEPRMNVEPRYINFGAVPAGSSSLPRTVTITNIGGANLLIDSLFLAGSNPSQFDIVEDNASGRSLPPGATANLSVQFNPTSEGLKSATINIISNDPDYLHFPYTVYMWGNGDIVPVPDITVEPPSINFGPIAKGTSSADEMVTITNDGDGDLIIGAVNIVGANPGDFVITSDGASGRTLAPDEFAVVSVRFSPSSTGVKSAAVQVFSSDPDEHAVYVPLRGTGTGPDIDVNPTSVNFSYVQVGTTSLPKTVTVTNEGTSDLNIGTVILMGGNYLEFSVASDNASSKALPPGFSTEITVTFSPTTAGLKWTYLIIPSDDPVENPVTVTLGGTGTTEPLAPDITVSPLSIDFGNVPVGTDSATHNVTVTNDGTADLLIGTLTIVNDRFTISNGNISNQIIPPDTSANISVIFSPLITGTMGTNLTIPSNDPNEAETNVSLTGTGILYTDLAITKSDSPDPVATNGNLTYIITVTNNGPSNASGVIVIDNLPAGTVFQSATTVTGSASESAGTVTWSIGSLNIGASANLTILVTAPSTAGTITNNASVTSSTTDPITANNSASENTTVAAPTSADLAITKSDSPDPVATNGNLTYIITVTNNGPANASGVSVIDNLPAGTVFQSATTVTGSASESSGTVTWSIGALNIGTSANLTIMVTAPSVAGPITNTATVNGAETDPITANNSASENTTVAAPTSADLAITKSDSPDPVATNGNLTYVITVTNNGPSNASVVNVIDNLPAGTVFQSATTLTGTAGYASGNVTWSIGSLNIGASANLTIVVTAPSTTGTITNTATVTGAETDPVMLNNNASTTTTVLPAGNLPNITVNPMLIDFGPVLVNAPSASQNVTVTNDGIADLIIGTLTIDNPQFVIISGNITGSIMPAGASANITVRFTPTAQGLQSASLTIPSNDPDENSVTVTLRGTGIAPDITVVPLSIAFGQVERGTSSVIKKVTVTNNGTALLVIGNLTIDNSRFTISSGNISGQTLLPGASTEIMLIFRPAAAIAYSAVLAIPSNDPDEITVNVALSGTGTSPGPGPNPPEPTPTPTPTTTGGMGPQIYFTVDFLGKITEELADSRGRPVKKMEAPSPDGIHKVEIEAGTAAADNAGLMLTRIEIRETPAPTLPENTILMGKAFEFKPSGTVFDKPITLTLGYNVGELPDGVTSVGAAYYTSTDGWIYLEPETGGVAELGKVTAPVSHFTVFAVLARVTPREPKPEPPPEPAPEPEPEPAIEPARFTLGNLTINLSEFQYSEILTYVARTGEEAIISADITNNGGQSGTFAAVLMINGTERERKEITLQAGQTGTVSFTVTGNEPGLYTVVIGNLTGDFLSQLWINWWLIAGTAGILVLITWLVWYIIKRRKKLKAPA